MSKLLTNIEQVQHFWGNFFLKNSKSILKKFLTWKTRNVHRLKQNFIFCLVHWNKEFNLDWYPSHAQESFRTYNSSFWIRVAVVVFLNPKTLKEYNKKRRQEAIPYTLSPTNLLISLLPAPQLNVKRTIWKGL